MGTVVLNAVRKGLDVQKFHVVGHSLGAQLCGYMGRKIIQQSNHAVKLPRITGLEPANPGFFPPILLQHLSYSDADFVDIVHTDTNFYGQPHATGTADFWPNDGSRIQPGCPFGLFLPLTQNGRFHLESVTPLIIAADVQLFLELTAFELNFSPF